MELSEKIRLRRKELHLTQPQLAEKVGVSTMSILSYEKGTKSPRRKTLISLAKALEVSIDYLEHDEIEDMKQGKEKDEYVEKAQEQLGTKDSRTISDLLDDNKALFAGGSISQNDKDAFFEAVMRAYLTCKEEARKTWGKG